MVAAGKRSTNIVQVGMQRRSYDLFLEARKVMVNGINFQHYLQNKMWNII